ncbi:hypothetical protein Nps_03040 [Candidatus Nanopusillus acidilobi]|nr:hypothetical protein Nps_03040 [Candidatus Nanopusillus acidilobi]
MRKSDSLDSIIGDDIENINPAAIYYFTKGFIKECENLRVCEVGEIKIEEVLEYLGYGEELIMLFKNKRSSIKKMLKYMNINYKRYENSGREFAEKYFRYNYIEEIFDIGPERVAELINRCVYSKSYYFLFRENPLNNKRERMLLHY